MQAVVVEASRGRHPINARTRNAPLPSTQPNPTQPTRYAFFDTDGVIEKAHPGMTIADIFRDHGEEYFRKCEAQVRARG